HWNIIPAHPTSDIITLRRVLLYRFRPVLSAQPLNFRHPCQYFADLQAVHKQRVDPGEVFEIEAVRNGRHTMNVALLIEVACYVHMSHLGQTSQLHPLSDATDAKNIRLNDGQTPPV